MSTPQEIAELKQYWLDDPCYDLEDADGFEEHREELRSYRLQQEAKWRAEREESLKAKAEALGCPGNLKLAEYVNRLETRISLLSARLDAIEAD